MRWIGCLTSQSTIFQSNVKSYCRTCYDKEAYIWQSLLSAGKKRLVSQFNFTYRYIDDVLSINNPDFENYLGQMYPPKLEIKDTKQYEVPLSRMLHDILDDDQIQRHPPLIGHYTNFLPLLIWTLLPNLTFFIIVQGFHRTYATGAACQQRTLTPPDTWSCPTLGLACDLMSRPISPELVLSPDFWISNIHRYFSFASDYNWIVLKHVDKLRQSVFDQF